MQTPFSTSTDATVATTAAAAAAARQWKSGTKTHQ
jgi:hypothetical protein